MTRLHFRKIQAIGRLITTMRCPLAQSYFYYVNHTLLSTTTFFLSKECHPFKAWTDTNGKNRQKRSKHKWLYIKRKGGFYFQSRTPGALLIHNRTRASDSHSAIISFRSVDVIWLPGTMKPSSVSFKNYAKPHNMRESGMLFSRPYDTSQIEQTNV